MKRDQPMTGGIASTILIRASLACARGVVAQDGRDEPVEMILWQSTQRGIRPTG
jgi:hypothetical protein